MGRLIIDGNSLGHAQHNATKLSVRKSDGGEFQTQAIFGMVKSMRQLLERYPGWKILILWDGEAQWRKAIHPAYKENRKAKNEVEQAHKNAYKAQSAFIRKAMSLLGILQTFATTLEADDMAGILVKKLSAAGEQIVLVSGDRDWLQLVRPGVTWFDPIRDHTVNISNFAEFTGYFTPEEFVQGKALMGDTSDNVPGVGGIGEKGAPEFLAQFKSVENFFAQCDSGDFVPKKVAHVKLSSPAGRAAFERNYKLMNLLDVPNPSREDVVVIKAEYSEAKFQHFCEKLAFGSVLRNFDNFMQVFRMKAAA